MKDHATLPPRPTSAREDASQQPPRKPYHSPRVEVLGTVYSLTFGQSPTAVGDSQPPFNTRP